MNFLYGRVSLWSGLESEVFFFSVDVELDFSFPDINVGIDVELDFSFPRMMDTFELGLMSNTTKSTGTRKSLILTRIFSAIPNGCRTDWSASCRHIDVGSRVVCSSFCRPMLASHWHLLWDHKVHCWSVGFRLSNQWWDIRDPPSSLVVYWGWPHYILLSTW